MYEIKATAALGVLRTVVQLMCTVGMKVRTLESEHLSFFQLGMKLRTVEAKHLSFFQFCDV